MRVYSRISWYALRLILCLGLVPGFAACVLPIPLAGSSTALKAVTPTLTMKVGEEKDLLPLIRVLNSDTVPFGPLTWTVSNPALLSIDTATGRAKGLAAGSVVVQVKAGDYQAGATQMVIDVLGEGSGIVKDVKVVPGSHTMAVGESVALRAQVFMPDGQINGNVVWSSSDNTIATVNQTTGSVTAVMPGRVTILAAYAPAPTFKGIADITVYPTRAEIPPSPSVPPRIDATAQVAASKPPGGGPQSQAEARVITLAGSSEGYADGTGTAAQFRFPIGIAVDGGGNVYVADIDNQCIRKVSPDGVVTTLAGSTRGFADGAGNAARFSEPSGVAVDGAGNVYVADTGNYCVRKITSAGVVSTVAGGSAGFADGKGSFAKFQNVIDIAVDNGGNTYVTDRANHRIRKVSPEGVVTSLAGSVAGYADGTGAAAKFDHLAGLTVDEGGNLYVADLHNNRVRKISPTGVVTTLAGSSFGYADGPVADARFLGPRDVAVDNTGALYLTDLLNNRIRRISPAGLVTTVAGAGNSGNADGAGTIAQFNLPTCIAVGPDGQVYVTDQTNHRIRKIVHTS